MNRFRIHITVVFMILASSVAVVWFDASAKRGAVNDARGPASNDVLFEPISPSSQSSSASKPAKRNELLRMELNWIFGSKPQRGWYLYTPLINRLIDTKHEPASKGFASALARWQKKSGLMPGGVLDDETLYKMIAEWQARRIKDRTPAQPGQLLRAPISDFYDPTRAEELRQVERKTYAAYKRLVAAALAERSLGLVRNPKGPKGELAAGEKYLKIISSFRSREYQEKLRRESPNSGTAGLAVNSPHFTGRALDLYVGGEPVDTLDSNRAIQVRTPEAGSWQLRIACRTSALSASIQHWTFVFNTRLEGSLCVMPKRIEVGGPIQADLSVWYGKLLAGLSVKAQVLGPGGYRKLLPFVAGTAAAEADGLYRARFRGPGKPGIYTIEAWAHGSRTKTRLAHRERFTGPDERGRIPAFSRQ